ncbi:hypothetical protein T07_8413 [Trichinella nelsoni]|uniref:Uncharacterized protein n=1 Tax=Trichinella nelsoni TaxID=6336 RepID=A0A0V0RDC3_9BILA|nr:hypothetical protein T07_8413 [Trichinella nelsoni]
MRMSSDKPVSEVWDEPSRSAYGRTIERGTPESGNRKTSAKDIAVDKSFGTLIAAHAVEDTPDPP